MVVFHIGHPAYTGINKFAFAANFPAAVAALVERGADRTEARSAVRSACNGNFATVTTPRGVVEVSFVLARTIES